MLRSAAAGLIAIVVALAGIGPAAAEPLHLDADALDRSIGETLQRREYQWRLPRTEPGEGEEDNSGPIRSFFKWIGNKLSDAAAYVGELLRTLWEQLRSIFPKDSSAPERGSSGWRTSVRLLLAVALVAAVLVLIYAVRKAISGRRRREPETAGAPISAAPDLASEEIRADVLPAERWRALARKMWDQGELRLAVRAFYLAALAKLADSRLVSIESHKSDMEYKRELDRHARENTGLLTAFGTAVVGFEKIWYGLKPVSDADVNQIEALYGSIVRLTEAHAAHFH